MPNHNTPTADGDLNVSHSNLLHKTDANTLTIYATNGYLTEQGAKNKFANATGKYGSIDCSQVMNVIENKSVNLLRIQAGCEASEYIDVVFKRMNTDNI